MDRIAKPVIEEKRFHHRQRLDLDLIWRLASDPALLFARTEPSEFRQIVSNLLDNAIEACPGGGVGLVSKADLEDLPLEIVPAL